MNNLNYGIIGNCTTAALVSIDGSIDWLCMPRFDSASVFAKILDKNNGGFMSFDVANKKETTQKYIENTNLLKTKFKTEDGIFEVIDFMPRYFFRNGDYYCPPDVIRYVRHIYGKPRFKTIYDPRLEYSTVKTEIIDNGKYITAYTKEPYNSMHLYSNIPNSTILNQEEITLEEDCFFLLSYNVKLFEQTIERTYLKLERTKVYWLNWSEITVNYNKYNREIKRSALILKLLSYQKTGAIVAALTTSIPETLGGIRNWDYRYCWIRDGSMVIRILTELGHFSVADRYMKYIISLMPEKDEALQVMYGIGGEKRLKETLLKNLSGYENSSPVRIGNAAYSQKQNDIYGIMMDAIYYYISKFQKSLSYSEDLWTIVRHTARIVAKNWHSKDRGIWELRNNSKHFTFSKVLCWTAIDRAKKIAILLNQNQYVEKWQKLEDEIRKDIENKAWNKKKEAYTQAYNSEDLDSSVLLMESYGFIEAKDPRYVKTVKAIKKELGHDGLLYRYKNEDDFGKPESAFTICSFWLVKALYEIGKKEEAVKRFEKLLSYSNHLGLFSEDLDFKTKRLLGNFPQAYSHLALIEIAIKISESSKSSEESIKKVLKGKN